VRREKEKKKKEEEKKKKNRKKDWALTQFNFYWAFQQFGPRTCWAQYPGIQGPSPKHFGHPFKAQSNWAPLLFISPICIAPPPHPKIIQKIAELSTCARRAVFSF
jgi:hypothetical protein